MRPDFDDEFLSVEITEPAAPLSCLACRERLAQLRGVCPRCYKRHFKAVRAGQTTWAALVAAGAVLPAQSAGWAWRGRPPDTDRGTTP